MAQSARVDKTGYCRYNIRMDYEFDPGKNAINIVKHGFPLTAADFFDWETALFEADTRFDYPEPRFKATGYIGPRLHVLIFCLRHGVRRIISLRKANKREENTYARAQT